MVRQRALSQRLAEPGDAMEGNKEMEKKLVVDSR